jgi:hypothetical protein
MGIEELIIEGDIPQRPVRQPLKGTSRETFKAAFLLRHTLGLQTMYYFRHFMIREIRRKFFKRGAIFVKSQSLP